MNNRKIFKWIGPAVLLLALSAIEFSAQSKLEPQAKPLPNLSLKTADDRVWNLNERRGSIVVMNFWATWCAPCREEIPVLVSLFEKYKKQGVEIVGVNVDSENTRQIDDFIKDFRMSYPILLTVPGSLLSRQKAVPMTLLIDEKGILAKKYVGAIKKSILEKDIKDLLNKKTAD